jgi:hypothetical protein
MLTSITPLGERSRGFRWGITVTAFAIGSTAAGAGLGALLGLLGGAVAGSISTQAALAILAVALGLGVAADAGLAGVRLPTVRRQVNEGWLNAYRGWVYGLGFGVQLGLGVVTIVSTSAVYVTFLAALLSASAGAGAIIGGAFGLIRAATVLPAARVSEPSQLVALGDRLRRWGSRERPVGLAAQLALTGVAVAIALVAV